MIWCQPPVGHTVWAPWVVNTPEPLEGVNGLHLGKASLASCLLGSGADEAETSSPPPLSLSIYSSQESQPWMSGVFLKVNNKTHSSVGKKLQQLTLASRKEGAARWLPGP